MNTQGKKRQKTYYYNLKRFRSTGLDGGLTGFLCFCNLREKECLKEAMNLLTEYLERQQTNENTESKSSSAISGGLSDNEADEDDIEDALAHEIAEVKRTTFEDKQFKVIESGAKNILFIRCSFIDTVELAATIMKDTFETKELKTRFLLRLVPIESTCKAALSDIKETVTTIVHKHFSGEPKTFSVIYNHRNNSSLNRDEIIKEVAAIVSSKNEKHVVNLKNPDLAVILEVIRNVCLMSVVQDYFKYRKYNLHQLCDKNEPETQNIQKAEASEENK